MMEETKTTNSLVRLKRTSNQNNSNNDDDSNNKKCCSLLLLSSSSGMIPEEQMSNIFSFLVLNDLLQLVLVSKEMKHTLFQLTHHLSTMPEDTSYILHNYYHHEHNIMSHQKKHGNHQLPIHHPPPPSSSPLILQPPPQNLERFNNNNDSKKNKKKQRLNVSLNQLQHIVNRFHNIRYLALYGLSDLSDSFLPIINHCPSASNLVSIELHDCRIILHNNNNQQHPRQHSRQHHHHQFKLHQNNKRLQHVSITGTIFAPYTTFLESFVVSSLQYLEFSGCHNLHDEDVLSIFKHTSRTLKELHLSNNCNLIHPNIKSDILTTLDFKQCQNLQSLPSLYCPNLLHLNLSFCTSLNDVALHQIVSSSSSSLLTLYLKGCKQLKQPNFTSPRCQQLQTLDISLCSQITQMEIFSPHLLSLTVRSPPYG